MNNERIDVLALSRQVARLAIWQRRESASLRRDAGRVWNFDGARTEASRLAQCAARNFDLARSLRAVCPSEINIRAALARVQGAE